MELQNKSLDYDEKEATGVKIYLDEGRCKGCGYCVEFCPRDALKMSNELNPKGYLLPMVDDITKCSACGLCEMLCPDFAIKIAKPPKK